MIKAVVFDMGGVVLTMESSPELCRTYEIDTIGFLAEHDIHIPDSPEVFGKKLEEAEKRRKQYGESSLREVPPLESWSDFYLRDYGVEKAKLFPIADELSLRWTLDRSVTAPRVGLKECLGDLRSQGMRLAVISNTMSRSFMITKLHDFGVSPYFEYVLLSSVCGIRKPDPAIFGICADTMGLAKTELAYVGDTISRDVIGAKSAGWELMIRILNPTAREPAKERESALESCVYRPDYVIQELPELPEIIRQYNIAHADETL